MVTKILSVLIAFPLILVTSYSQASCALTDRQISAVKVPLVQLLLVEDNDAKFGYIADKASPHIERLKAALIALIDARLACEKEAIADPTAIREDLLKALQLDELNEVEAIYGYDLQIFAERPEATSDLLIVQASFGIPCGSDHILLVYRYRDKAWKRDLLWKSEPYRTITGAHSDYYDYLVLPVKAGEPPKLVIVHGSAWCTSSWEPLVFDVVKLADKNTRQTTLLHQQLITYSGQSFVHLKKRANGFELEADVAMLDSDILTRKGIYRYRLEGDQVIREQPLANNVRDFVDEWLALSSPMLKNFTLQTNREQLTAIHKNLKERNGFYGAVKRCDEDDLMQVTITFNGTKDADQEEVRHFYVKPVKQGYLMHSSTTKANSSCIGEEIVAK